MRMNILVTGGAGYIGSHTCKALAASGHNPIVLDDLSVGHRWAVKWEPLVVGDIGDRALVTKTVKRFRICATIRFAAHAYVAESVERPRRYFENNVSKTLVLLDALFDAGVHKIVFSFSCATYRVPRGLPIAEHHPQSSISPYGASKLFVENVLNWYERAYGLRYMNLRYFNAAGADPDGEIGEDHTPETDLIPLVIATQSVFCALWNRLRHARWYRRARLRARVRSRERSRQSARSSSRGRSKRQHQSGDRSWSLDPRCDFGRRNDQPQARSYQRGSSPARRSAGADCQPTAWPGPAGMEAREIRSAHYRAYRLGPAPEKPCEACRIHALESGRFGLE
jgi:NAD dependent epimerase/dehydratase family